VSRATETSTCQCVSLSVCQSALVPVGPCTGGGGSGGYSGRPVPSAYASSKALSIG
jgi:hypothetical protein